MADVGVFTKNADIQARCGTNANTTSKAVAATDVYVLNVEGLINAASRHNWSDDYATLNADVKGLLTEAGACLCAMYVINWDMSGFTSRLEAQTMLDMLRDRAQMAIGLLKDIAAVDFVTGA